MFESVRCDECGASNFTYSTEWKDTKWLWKKICKSCDEVLEKDFLEVKNF